MSGEPKKKKKQHGETPEEKMCHAASRARAAALRCLESLAQAGVELCTVKKELFLSGGPGFVGPLAEYIRLARTFIGYAKRNVKELDRAAQVREIRMEAAASVAMMELTEKRLAKRRERKRKAR